MMVYKENKDWEIQMGLRQRNKKQMVKVKEV